MVYLKPHGSPIQQGLPFLVWIYSTGSILLAACSGLGAPQPASTPAMPWDYVAIGDSFAGRSYYPKIYAGYLEEDLGVEVNRRILWSGGITNAGILDKIRNDEDWRNSIIDAEVITISFGPGSFDDPEARYFSGDCGGEDNQDCLRAGLATAQSDWEAILDEVLGLRSVEDTLIRTLVFGSWPYFAYYGDRVSAEDLEVVLAYFLDMNEFVAQSAARRDIPVADIGAALQGPDLNRQPPADYFQSDGLHLSEKGSTVVADALRQLGYQYALPEGGGSP